MHRQFVGLRLAQLRCDCGKSQQLAADFCGISQAALSRYESGARVPDALTLARLCEFYGVGVAAVFAPGPPAQENSPLQRAVNW